MRPDALPTLRGFPLLAAVLLPVLFAPPPAGAQDGEDRMDLDRARILYVSNDPAHHSIGRDFERDIRRKANTDSIYEAVTAGVVDYQKVTFRSSVGDMDIPAYLFQPLGKRGPGGHAALIWVHGGVHGDWTANHWPFVKEAVERGYVVIAPEYRGSTGYGQEHHDAIDYGGYEVDDVVTAHDWMADNDRDVDFVEAEMLVHALQVKKPDLAETKIYRDPPGGHSFSRRVDMNTLTRDDTPEQRDSWNRVRTFPEWKLRPYEDGSGRTVDR